MDRSTNVTCVFSHECSDGIGIHIAYDSSDNIVVVTANGHFSSTIDYYLSNGILMALINSTLVEYVTPLDGWNRVREYMGYKKIGQKKYEEILEKSVKTVRNQIKY
jgi:hypothetical protein